MPVVAEMKEAYKEGQDEDETRSNMSEPSDPAESHPHAHTQYMSLVQQMSTEKDSDRGFRLLLFCHYRHRFVTDRGASFVLDTLLKTTSAKNKNVQIDLPFYRD
ncbi:hypothetical protein PoB_001557600 [Plakobranchus ocellatus]|uniref:Uncharacterized protein n=1 Tax=Plakobranchus ocellatus TaxID=259542 RepID=A0AAV3YZU0_9GAST|nr:hypothetical protein PoB_001557600 [Plakobranchus ocellatus]